MRPIATDGVAWSVGRSVTTVSLAKTAEPIVMPFGTWTRAGRKNRVLDRDLNPPREATFFGGGVDGTGQPRTYPDIRRSISSKRLSRRQNRYDAAADWVVLDVVRIGATWRV